MSRKRLRDGKLEAATEENKRFRSALNESAEELLCPITMALPIDPVTAEDGMIYERDAVQEWIAKGNGKSPSTNEPMGPRLFPAPRVRSMIERMVKSGAISGDKVEAWQQRLKDEGELKELKERIERGDARAMYTLGNCYDSGVKGLPKDNVEAFKLYKRASDLGHGSAEGCLGMNYLFGHGTERNVAIGMMHLGRATVIDGGSAHACYVLGKALGGVYRSIPGLPSDSALATKFFRMASSCRTQNGSDAQQEVGAQWLREHSD